jgi:hypothetical protein
MGEVKIVLDYDHQVPDEINIQILLDERGWTGRLNDVEGSTSRPAHREL